MAILRSKIETVTAWKVSKYGVISGPYFPVFGLNTEIYFINFCIQSEYRKIQARNNSVFGHFLRSEFCWYKLKFIFMCFDVGLKCINQNHCKSLLDSKENTWWKVLQIFYNFLIHIWISHTASIFFYLNPFSTNLPLLYSLKTSKNRRFSDVFRGYRSGTLVENGLNSYPEAFWYFPGL